jgi:phosphoribosylaminoimidazole-succinocarboxamide synthase
MSKAVLAESRLPLPLLRRGKVREVYEVDDGHLLIVASDRVSAFDVVMREPIPYKGAVLTQLSAFWFHKLSEVFPSHYVSASTGEILDRVPRLKGVRDQIAGRAMLVLRAEPVPFECVVRGYITGTVSAELWPASLWPRAWSRARDWIHQSFPPPRKPRRATTSTSPWTPSWR